MTETNKLIMAASMVVSENLDVDTKKQIYKLEWQKKAFMVGKKYTGIARYAFVVHFSVRWKGGEA